MFAIHLDFRSVVQPVSSGWIDVLQRLQQLIDKTCDPSIIILAGNDLLT